MTVTAAFASLTALFAVALGLAFFWVTRLPKCPRCGCREWVPLPHKGRYFAYCRNCLHEVDMANWSGK
jgi:hypothetical protein